MKIEKCSDEGGYMKNLWGLVMLSLVLASSSSCTKRSAQGDEMDTASMEKTQTNDDFQLEENKTQETTEVTPAPEVVEENKTEIIAQEEATPTALPVVAEVKTTDQVREYVTSKGDTLMLISFKIYGDYSKWKEIKEMNKSVLAKKKGPLKSGITLKYLTPSVDFIQQANGEPYLIKMKDTLGRISKKVYSTKKRWKDIWKNNAYIKNPNIIFAGFTLFYVKDDKKLAKR